MQRTSSHALRLLDSIAYRGYRDTVAVRQGDGRMPKVEHTPDPAVVIKDLDHSQTLAAHRPVARRRCEDGWRAAHVDGSA